MFHYRICLFVRGFRPTRQFFTHMETTPLPIKGCKCWPMLGTRGHWAVRVLRVCQAYCDKGHPFIMVISEDRDTHTYCRAFDNEAVTTCVYDLGLTWLGFEHTNFRLRCERSYPLCHRCGFTRSIKEFKTSIKVKQHVLT